MKVLAMKMLVLGLIALALLAGVGAVRGVLEDRLRYRAEALDDVGRSLAGPQRLAGPALVVPYVERIPESRVGADGSRSLVVKTVHRTYVTLPERLDVDGTLRTDERKRGLFGVTGYVWDGTLRGTLRVPDPASLPRTQEGTTLDVGTPRLVLAVGDVRGLRSVAVTVDGRGLEVEPGTPLPGVASGVSAPLAATPAPGTELAFALAVRLGGATRFEAVPLGRETRMRVRSPWPHPSFGGRFLPLDRRIGADGFDATWAASALASTARDAWTRAAHGEPAAAATGALDTFSVELADPVDIYALTDRATKYAVLFVALTLGVFALYELVRGMHVHPLQYLFVGAALVTFFLLLLALAEHVGFAVAYLVASGACVALLVAYVAGVLGSRVRGLSFGGGVALLYAALYAIVQSEQNALLLGSLLVFAILSAVMLATRHVDWAARLAEGRRGLAGS
jgi:inner membrane protein